MHGPGISNSVIGGSRVGFPVQITGLINCSVQVEIKLASLERTVFHDLMTLPGAVTHIVMENELIHDLLQLLVSSLGIQDLISGVGLGGLVIQNRVVLTAIFPSSFVGFNYIKAILKQGARSTTFCGPKEEDGCSGFF